MTDQIKTQKPIPLWVNVMQGILVLIMLSQVYMYFFDHDLMAATGVSVEGTPMLNLIYEMGGRTFVMAVAAIFVMITQNTRQYLLVLIMNVLREGIETVVDPLYPVLNAPGTPIMDFWIHVVIVAIEVLALLVVWKRLKNNS